MTARKISLLAALAACNSALELTVGTLLHALNVPATGAIMVGLNLIVYACCFRIFRKFGSVCLVGLVTALLNLFLAGAFKPGAVIPIFIEALMVDLVFAWLGSGRRALIVAGIAAGLVALGWSLFGAYVFFGKDVYATLVKLAGLKSLASASFLTLLSLVALFRVVIGTCFALAAYRVLDLLAPTLIRCSRGIEKEQSTPTAP